MVVRTSHGCQTMHQTSTDAKVFCAGWCLFLGDIAPKYAMVRDWKVGGSAGQWEVFAEICPLSIYAR